MGLFFIFLSKQKRSEDNQFQQKMSGTDLIKNLQRDSRNIKDGKYVSITISATTHEKLNNLCWLIRKDKKPKMGLVTSNIIEHFFENNRDEIILLQSKKNNLF